MSHSALPGSSLAVVEEILAVKWPNPGAKFRELDRLDEEIQQELRQAHQEYSKSPNKKNRIRLLQALQTKIEALNKEYQHAITQQNYFAEMMVRETKDSATVGWGTWLLRSVQRLVGNDALQKEQYYAGIAQGLAKKLQDYVKDWREISNTAMTEKNGKKARLMNTQTGNCVADLSELMQDSMGYNSATTDLPEGEGGSLGIVGNNPSVLLPNNRFFLLTYDAIDSTTGISNIFSKIYSDEDISLIIGNTLPGDKSYPSVASFDNGQFLVAWHSNSSEFDYDIYAQCFDADFKPIGAEVRVNTDTLGRQWFPAISIWQDSFVIAWESDNSSTIDFNDETSIEEATKFSGIFARFFNAVNDDDNFSCDWATGLDKPISTKAVGHLTGTGVDIVAVEDLKTSLPQFIFSFVSSEGVVHIRPFSITGDPLRYSVKINEFGPSVKVPSGISIENLYNGKILIVWNEQRNDYYPSYCSPLSQTAESNCLKQEYSYYNGVCYEEYSSEKIINNNVKGQIFSIYDSEVMFGFPSVPQTLIATSTVYNETFPVIGTFLAGNFVTVWKAVSNYMNSTVCSSNLYARFYDYNSVPLSTLYCISNDSQEISDAKDLAISTFSGNFILSWSDYDNNSDINRKINVFIYENQYPACLIDDDGCNIGVPSVSITKQGNKEDLFTINFAGYFDWDPEGAQVSFTINQFLDKNYTSTNPNLAPALPVGFQFNSNGELTIRFNGNDTNYVFRVVASDPYGGDNKFLTCLDLQTPKFSAWDKAKPVLSALGSLSGAVLAVWAYMWRQYTLKKYREFQHPFASEIHECLNLSYSDFSSDPGKEYAAIVSLMLQTMRQKTGRDIQKLRTAKDTDNQLLYHYYTFLFARAILNLSGSMELLRNTAVCGVELKGPFASREILLSDFKAEADNLVEDVISMAQNSQVPEEWKRVFEEQQASEEKERHSTDCRDRVRNTCCPFQRSDVFRLFQTRKLMSRALSSRALSSSQHSGALFEEAKSPTRGLSTTTVEQPQRRHSNSNLFVEYQKPSEEGGDSVLKTTADVEMLDVGTSSASTSTVSTITLQ